MCGAAGVVTLLWFRSRLHGKRRRYIGRLSNLTALQNAEVSVGSKKRWLVGLLCGSGAPSEVGLRIRGSILQRFSDKKDYLEIRRSLAFVPENDRKR